jgi:hypothetical protein
VARCCPSHRNRRTSELLRNVPIRARNTTGPNPEIIPPRAEQSAITRHAAGWSFWAALHFYRFHQSVQGCMCAAALCSDRKVLPNRSRSSGGVGQGCAYITLRRATYERRTAEPLLLPCARCTRSGRVQRGPAIGRIIIRYGRRHLRGACTQILLVERTVFADHK